MAAFAKLPGMAYYNASKAGFGAASETLHRELRGSGVHVMTVYPGVIHTDLGRAAIASYGATWRVRMQPAASVDALAHAIVRAWQCRKHRLLYPHANRVTRWVPALTDWALERFAPNVMHATRKSAA